MKISAPCLRCASLAVMSFVLASSAFAQLPDADQAKKTRKWEAKFSEIVRELKLTEEQQKAMAQQHSRERVRSLELRQKMRTVRDQITAELNKEATDTAKVNALVADLKALTGQRIEHQIQGILELKKILTPEQFASLNEKRQRDHQRRKGGGRNE